MAEISPDPYLSFTEQLGEAVTFAGTAYLIEDLSAPGADARSVLQTWRRRAEASPERFEQQFLQLVDAALLLRAGGASAGALAEALRGDALAADKSAVHLLAVERAERASQVVAAKMRDERGIPDLVSWTSARGERAVSIRRDGEWCRLQFLREAEFFARLVDADHAFVTGGELFKGSRNHRTSEIARRATVQVGQEWIRCQGRGSNREYRLHTPLGKRIQPHEVSSLEEIPDVLRKRYG